jgi:carbonic anhydrase
MDAAIDGMRRLVDGNAVFRKSVDASLLKRLNTRTQEPFAAVLTCSDSRVSPVKVFNLSLGEVFEVRVVGNSASDPSVLGSLEYAVEHLHTKHLIVLGHTGCGAVRASMDGTAPENLKSVMRDMERARYKNPMDRQEDVDLTAENNVRLQLRMISDNSRIIADAVASGRLELHGAMYDLATGGVRFI